MSNLIYNQTFQTSSVSSALFFKDGVDVVEFSYKIKHNLVIGEYSPFMMPAAPGMPEDFPRFSIVSSHGYSINLFGNRLEFTYSIPTLINDDQYSNFAIELKKLIDILYENTGINVHRIGYVRNYFSINAHPSAWLEDNFLKTKAEAPLKEVGVKLVKRDTFENREINNVYMFSCGTLNNSEAGVILCRDINSAIEIDTTFDLIQAKTFIDFSSNCVLLENATRDIGIKND